MIVTYAMYLILINTSFILESRKASLAPSILTITLRSDHDLRQFPLKGFRFYPHQGVGKDFLKVESKFIPIQMQNN